MKIFEFIVHFCRWIYRVCLYAVFLWDDNTWDYGGVLRMLQFRIRLLREWQQKHSILIEGNPEAHKEMISQMLEAEKLLADIRDDKSSPELEAFYSKHPLVRVPLPNPPPNIAPFTYKSHGGNEEEESRLIKESMAYEGARWNRFFDHLKAHMGGWWD